MKSFVFSDLHGDECAMRKVNGLLLKEKPDRILLLGDILHGRYGGGLSDVANLLRSIEIPILAVRGNCDYESDSMTLGFDLPEARSIHFGMHVLHLSHVFPYLAFPAGDVVLFGHTHRKCIYVERGVLYMNPGSVSLPRDGVASYGLIEDRVFSLKDMDGNLLESIEF